MKTIQIIVADHSEDTRKELAELLEKKRICIWQAVWITGRMPVT